MALVVLITFENERLRGYFHPYKECIFNSLHEFDQSRRCRLPHPIVGNSPNLR